MTPTPWQRTLGVLIPALIFTIPTFFALHHVIGLALACAAIWAGLKEPGMFAKVNWDPVAMVMTLLFGVVVLGMAYTPAPWEWSKINLSKYSTLLWAGLLLVILRNNRAWQVRSLHAFAWAMGFVLLSTWANIWFVLPWSRTQTPGWGLSHHVMYDYIIQNVMMAFFTLFALSQVAQHRSKWVNAAWVLVAMAAVISITHLSEGRTGVVVLASGLIGYLWTRRDAKGRWLILVLCLVLILGLTLMSPPMRERVQLAILEVQHHDADIYSSIGQRLHNYRIVPELIAERPFFGHGTGAYHTEICRFLGEGVDCNVFRWHPHNQFLAFGADHGLLGIALYIALIASLFRCAWRSNNNSTKALLTGLTCILLVDSLFNSPLFSAREHQFFAYLAAVLASLNLPVNPSQAPVAT